MTSRSRPPVDLNAEVRGAGHPALVLHGLFGSLINWRSVAKTLAGVFEIHSVDLRNHGRSPHATTHTYADLLGDVEAYLDKTSIRETHVMGHSMGGRVAMALAVRSPKRVSRLVVVDISLRQSPSYLRTVLDGMLALDLAGVCSRRAVDERLARSIDDARTRGFLLTNLVRGEDGCLRWRINLRAIAECLEEIGSVPRLDGVYHGPALFVRGGSSRYVNDGDVTELRRFFPQARIVTVEGAGHWVHTDAPAEFSRIVCEFLRA